MTLSQKKELLQAWLTFVRAFNAYLKERGLPTVDYDPDQKRDKDGKFAKEDVGILLEQAEAENKIKELDKIDFTKEATLPGFPKHIAKRYELTDKPILLKANIIQRNRLRHPDVTPEDARKIIGLSLYKPGKVFESDKNDYLCFVSTAQAERYSDVVIDVKESANNYEIVHFYWLNNKTLRKIERRDREI